MQPHIIMLLLLEYLLNNCSCQFSSHIDIKHTNMLFWHSIDKFISAFLSSQLSPQAVEKTIPLRFFSIFSAIACNLKAKFYRHI